MAASSNIQCASDITTPVAATSSMLLSIKMSSYLARESLQAVNMQQASYPLFAMIGKSSCSSQRSGRMSGESQPASSPPVQTVALITSITCTTPRKEIRIHASTATIINPNHYVATLWAIPVPSIDDEEAAWTQARQPNDGQQ